MGPELLEIQPQELKFIFELKKTSECSVQLVNNSDQFVAFKVKTTSPKKYCVRPNVGIVHPRSFCDFTVTMQAQRVAPSDMQCRDKFLIQSTIVQFGALEEHISSSTFAKDNGKYIEEHKLRVVLVSPPNSPVLLPINGALKQEQAYEAPAPNDQVLSSVENLLPHMQVPDNMEELKPAKNVQELKPTRDVQELKPTMDWQVVKPAKDWRVVKPAKDVLELKPAKDAMELELKPAKDVLETELAKVEEKLRQTKDVGELTLAKDLWEVKLAKDVEEDVEEVKLAKDVEEDVEELRPAKDVGVLKLVKDEELRVVKDVEDLEPAKDMHESKLAKDVELRFAKAVELHKLVKDEELRVVKDVEDLEPAKDMHESKLAKDVELRFAKAVELQLAKDIEKLKLKLIKLELKQSEAETTITRLEKERNTSFEDRQTLKQEVAMLKTKTVVQNVQVGFPFLFVCMVALVSIYLGYKLHS